MDHLGFAVDTETSTFTVTEKKKLSLRKAAQRLLDHASMNKGLVSASMLAYFCGKAVSPTLTVPIARFYMRSLYTALSSARRTQGGVKVHLSETANLDLLLWRKLWLEERFMLKQDPVLCTH